MDYIDPAAITLKVISGIYSGVTTVELDNLAAETAATMTTKHPGNVFIICSDETPSNMNITVGAGIPTRFEQ